MRAGADALRPRAGRQPEPAAPRDRLGFFARLWARVIASDPGLARLHMALRALIGAALAAGALVGLAKLVGQPVTPLMIGAFLAMMTGVAVNDPAPRDQRLTMVAGAFVAGACVALAVSVAHVLWLGLALFCVVIFFSMLLRQFGPRWMAAGMLGFMSYFFALFTQATPAQLPWILVAIVIGVGIAAVVRFFVVRDRPERILANTLHAFQARASLVLDDLAARAGNTDESPRGWRRLRHSAEQLLELVLAVESAAGPPRPDSAAGTPGAWTSALFEAELALELLVDSGEALARGAPAAVRGALAATANTLRAYVDIGAPDAGRAAGEALDAARALDDAVVRADDSDERALWWRRAQNGVRTLTAAQPWRGAAAHPWTGVPDGSSSDGPPSPPATGASSAGGASPEWSSTLRLAVQATLAAALAILAGRALSPTRWYWAVIAAFVVFSQATTRAETLSRAWRRVLGTVVGAGVGLGIAALVGSDTAVAVVIALLAVFGAYYVMRVSYEGMVAGVTVAIALLYDVMGRAVPSLLLLRLEETLIGAALGVGVAALVFPSSSGEKMRGLVATLLRAAARPITRATLAVSRRDDLLADVRDVDRALGAVRSAARALWGARMADNPSPLVRRSRDAEALACAVRRLASAVEDGAHDALGDGDDGMLQHVGTLLAHNCDRVADGLERGREPNLGSVSDDLTSLRTRHPRGPARMLTEALADVDMRLAGIGRRSS